MIKISTSILSSNDRVSSIIKLNQTTSDYLHIDVMDGNFVPNKQFPIEETNKLITYSKIPIDIHLMVTDPEEYIDKLNNNNNIEFITIHIEIEKNIKQIINKIKERGYKVGISIKPNTDINIIKNYINDIDMILIMSVEPGFGGQEFIPSSIDKIKYIKGLNKKITIEIDGGINNTNINIIKEYADIAVVGSYITKNKDYNQAINKLKN